MSAVSKFSKSIYIFCAFTVSRPWLYINTVYVLYCFQDCTDVHKSHKSKAAINYIKVACRLAIFDTLEN